MLGVVCAIAMVRIELTVERPMLDLRLLHNRIFRQCNLVSALSMMSFLGLLFVMPLYLQLLRGQDALQSGLTTFPQAFGVMISSQFAGRLYARIGPRRLMTGGLLAAGLVITTFIGLDQDTSLWSIRIMMFVRGLCMGFAFVPMQAASYATISPADNGRASSIFSTQRQVAVSIGVAILASILSSYMSLSQPPALDRGRPRVDRLSSGVRRRGRVVLGRGDRRVVHPRLGRRGDDGAPTAMSEQAFSSLPDRGAAGGSSRRSSWRSGLPGRRPRG